MSAHPRSQSQTRVNRRDLIRTSIFSALPAAAGTAPPTGYITEPERRIPVVEQVDVVVCGAGPAGVAAALSAARSGANTRLLEVHGCLGGIWTAGLLSNIIDAGNKRGLLPEITGELRKKGAQIDSLRYDVEAMKLVLDEMCRKAGVKVLLHSRVTAAAKDGARLTSVITESRSGRQAWQAKVFIDATGDGDVAALAGNGFDFGHPESGKTQPMTLMALLMGVNYRELHAKRLMRGDGASSFAEGVSSKESKQNMVQELRRAGFDPSYTGVTLFPVRQDLLAFMVNHEYGRRAHSAQDISDATQHARADVNGAVEALRRLGGPWRNVRLVATGAQIGVREGRRIHGLYRVNRQDLERGARFPDAVCRVTAGVDIHSIEPETNKNNTDGGIRTQPYDIPVRALIAKDVDALMMAGRCISGDFFAHSSYRMTGNAVPMGEAAGALAARAARSGRPLKVEGKAWRPEGSQV